MKRSSKPKGSSKTPEVIDLLSSDDEDPPGHHSEAATGRSTQEIHMVLSDSEEEGPMISVSKKTKGVLHKPVEYLELPGPQPPAAIDIGCKCRFHIHMFFVRVTLIFRFVF